MFGMFERMKKYFTDKADSFVPTVITPVVEQVQSQVTQVIDDVAASASTAVVAVVDTAKKKAEEFKDKIIHDATVQAEQAADHVVTAVKKKITDAVDEMVEEIPLTIGKKIKQKAFGFFSSLFSGFGKQGEQKAGIVSEQIGVGISDISKDAGSKVNDFVGNTLSTIMQIINGIGFIFIGLIFGSYSKDSEIESPAVVVPELGLAPSLMQLDTVADAAAVCCAVDDVVDAPVCEQGLTEDGPSAGFTGKP